MTDHQTTPNDIMPEDAPELDPIYGGTQPAPFTDPQCATCHGTGVTGPYGVPGLAAVVQMPGAAPVPVWPEWHPCRPCSIPAGIPAQFDGRPPRPHRPGRGMTITIVETVTRGPAYGPDNHVHNRMIHLYIHNGDKWLWPHDMPGALEHADWSRGPAGFVIGEIWPGAEIGDSASAPKDPAGVSPLHTVLLTDKCGNDPCPLDPRGTP